MASLRSRSSGGSASSIHAGSYGRVSPSAVVADDSSSPTTTRYRALGARPLSERSASNSRPAQLSQNGYRSRTPLDQPAHLTACASSSASERPHAAQRTIFGTSAVESPPRRNVPTAGNSVCLSTLELKRMEPRRDRRHARNDETPASAGVSHLAERRRSRTDPAWGYHTSPVLKTGWATGPVPLRRQRSAGLTKGTASCRG
jgi:hypothetical protein